LDLLFLDFGVEGGAGGLGRGLEGGCLRGWGGLVDGVVGGSAAF
jgi:hypothetical protein